MKPILKILLCVLCLCSSACQAAPKSVALPQAPTPADDPAKVPPSQERSGKLSYEDYRTAEGRKRNGLTGTYTQDPHIWVYSEAFAKRFGLPSKWIDQTLLGAEALAYRIDWSYYGTHCGYFSDLEHCRPAPACVLEMYIPESADLPWNTSRLSSSRKRYVDSSIVFLVPQYKSDSPSYLQRWTKRGRRYHLGLDRVTLRRGGKGGFNGNYSVIEYDRRIYQGLDYISGTVSCSFGDMKPGAHLTVMNPHFYEDGSINYGYLDDIAHTVQIPSGFLQRVKAYQESAYEPDSLFNALKQRLIRRADAKSTSTKDSKE